MTRPAAWAGLAEILGWALAKEPGQRPTAQELLLESTAGPEKDATMAKMSVRSCTLTWFR